ncbi:DUF4352 domain-containing protein [Streptomyces graminofaciens]|uniref:DUF4352 domain-containing protein n=1 Tax=Streptomyces graminofaciens TaxID=68212 RepID=UPI002572CC71|nr:DUF4352 domain-containing protein [Streptomyces graminofaciens]
MRHTTTLLSVVLLLAVSGCSSDDEGSGKPTVTKASPTPTVASPSPSPSPSKAETLKLGDTANISADSEFTAAALGYTDKGITGVPELLSAGQKWSVVMVKVCNKGGEPIATTPLVWSLAYADGVRVEAAGMNAGELPQPLYPMEAKVSSGDCVKGNIAFTVPESGRPERVLYSPDALDEPVEWQIGK